MLGPFSIQGLLYPPIRCTLEITLGVVNWGPDVKKGFRGSKIIIRELALKLGLLSTHSDFNVNLNKYRKFLKWRQ